MSIALGLVPIALLFAGFPIFIVLLAGASLALAVFMNMPLSAIHQNLFGAINTSGLLAIPYFIFAGELMSRGSVAQRLVSCVGASVKPLPGALGVTTIGTATVFGAISGSSAASVASVGKVMHPAMTNDGYPNHFSAGMIISAGAIGVIIPPSIPMIVYGAASETSIPRLYAAGVLPGLLTAALLALYIIWRAKTDGFGSSGRFSWRHLLDTTRHAVLAIGAPVVVLGGIYGGFVSPTEAAALATVYALLVTRFAYRELPWGEVLEAAKSTVVFTSQILVIVSAAGLFSWVLTINQIPQAVVAWVVALEVSPWMFLLAINLLLLFIGCFMDPLSAILLLTPILMPVVNALGIDPVHFGIVMTLNLAIGLFTPPFGLNIFVAQSALGIKASDIYRGALPFFCLFILALLLITFVPSIALTSMNWFLF